MNEALSVLLQLCIAWFVRYLTTVCKHCSSSLLYSQVSHGIADLQQGSISIVYVIRMTSVTRC